MQHQFVYISLSFCLFFLTHSWPGGFHQSKRPSPAYRSCLEISGCILWSWVLLWKDQVSRGDKVSAHNIKQDMMLSNNCFFSWWYIAPEISLCMVHYMYLVNAKLNWGNWIGLRLNNYIKSEMLEEADQHQCNCNPKVKHIFFLRTLAGGMVWRCLWDRHQVSSTYLPKWRTSSLRVAVQLCPEEWYSHTSKLHLSFTMCVFQSFYK